MFSYHMWGGVVSGERLRRAPEGTIPVFTYRRKQAIAPTCNITCRSFSPSRGFFAPKDSVSRISKYIVNVNSLHFQEDQGIQRGQPLPHIYGTEAIVVSVTSAKCKNTSREHPRERGPAGEPEVPLVEDGLEGHPPDHLQRHRQRWSGGPARAHPPPAPPS